MVRISLILAVTAALAGCASERPIGTLGAQPSALSLAAQAAGKDAAAGVEHEIEARKAAQRSMAAKVLAAIALERVTGRKPDSERLIAAN